MFVLPISFNPRPQPANGPDQERSSVKSRGIAQMRNSSARALPSLSALSTRQGDSVTASSRQCVLFVRSCWLMLFYASVVRSAGKAGAAQKRMRPDVMRQVKFYLTQNYSSQITLEQLARRFEISSANLSRLFRREFGVGFNRYLTTLRLESAMALLHSTTLPVSEVALRCGFSDSSYFIRIFREHFGATPKCYRRGDRPAV